MNGEFMKKNNTKICFGMNKNMGGVSIIIKLFNLHYNVLIVYRLYTVYT